MKKITLRTKITLTIIGSLALAGIFYAANPSPFATAPRPIGVAAAPTRLIVSEFCSQNLETIDCLGNVSALATIPGPPDQCLERYMAMAPSQTPFALPVAWNPADIFVTQGTAVYKVAGVMPHCLRRSRAATRTTLGLRSIMWAHLTST